MKELEYLDEDLVIEGEYYHHQYPNTLSNAIYNYGDSDIREILAYIENNEQGMIITPEKLYYSFNQTGKIQYHDIHSLLYNPKTQTVTVNNTVLTASFLNMNYLVKLLSELSDITVRLDLKDDEKIEYYVSTVLDDLLSDMYEDVVLSNEDYMKIKEFKDEIALINTYPQLQKEEEYDVLNRHALEFFDHLELDSEEIDALQQIHTQHTNLNNKAFNDAMNQYEDLLNGLKGDPSKMNRIKSMASSLGINLDDLENKSPEELNQYIDDLCDQYHISRSQLETLAKRFSK